MTTIAETLGNILAELMNIEDVEACAVVSREGLLMGANMPQGLHAETFAAMTATMLGGAEAATMELNRGISHRVIAESEQCKLIVVGAGEKALLTAMTSPDANLGHILVVIDKHAEKVKQLL